MKLSTKDKNILGYVGVGLVVALLIVLCCLPAMTKRANYVPPPARSQWAPPFDPGNLPRVLPSIKQACLPGNVTYNGLVPCVSQSDCASCSEKEDMACVTVTGESNQLIDPLNNGDFVRPTTVNLYRPAGGECSGRGTKQADGSCKCNAGSLSAKGQKDNCDIQVLTLPKPGSYCLPSYTNLCDPYTSNTVLTNVGQGSQWMCECKYPDQNLFVQNTEGGSCSVVTACGANIPQMLLYDNNSLSTPALVLTDVRNQQRSDCKIVDGSPDFAMCPVFPNRLVSRDPERTDACLLPVETNPAYNQQYDQFVPLPYADPTCSAQTYHNKCTINVVEGTTSSSSYNLTYTIRGSGRAGDPALSRQWPPYPEPLPLNMSRCPDGWTGSGTVSDPCENPAKSFTFHYLDDFGQWDGKYVNLQDIRNIGYDDGTNSTPKSNTTPCANGEQSSGGTCYLACDPTVADSCKTEGSSSTCVNGKCNVISDSSCLAQNAIGRPHTLGALPWRGVNSQCQAAPFCNEQEDVLQKFAKWDETKNGYTIAPPPNCDTTRTAPVCTCTVPETTCTDDSACNIGGVTGNACRDGKCVCLPGSNALSCSVPKPPTESTVCSVLQGGRSAAWDGQLDGPILRENDTPFFFQEPGEYDNVSGGACVCEGVLPTESGGSVPLVPSYLLPGASQDSSFWWGCVPDPCYSSSSNASFNPDTQSCDCSGSTATAATGNEKVVNSSSFSWEGNYQVPSCQRDPCNPDGVTSGIIKVCSDDSDCSYSGGENKAATCDISETKQCFIFDIQAKKCTGDEDCGPAVNDAQVKYRCLSTGVGSDKKCAVLDLSRQNLTCSSNSDCDLGICEAEKKVCTGGCVCGNDTSQKYTDTNPLHATCTSPCLFNPCGKNGTCSVGKDGSAVCTCSPCYTGDRCEKVLKLQLGEKCSTANDNCCTGFCGKSWFFFGEDICRTSYFS